MIKKKSVDLSCDLGESFGIYRSGQDEKIMDIISSANIACGFHAGDPHVMRKAVAMAGEKGVCVGAHPGLPDLIGFGRRRMDISPDELKDLMTYQISALRGFVEARGIKLQHMVQHGALTAMAENDDKLAAAIMDSLLEVDPNLYYLAFEGSNLPEMARKKGLKVKMLAFADRAYDRNKRLISRRVPGAVIHETAEIVERVEQLISEGQITTIEGDTVPLTFDSIMLHGDSPEAVEIAHAVHDTIRKMGVEIRPIGELN